MLRARGDRTWFAGPAAVEEGGRLPRREEPPTPPPKEEPRRGGRGTEEPCQGGEPCGEGRRSPARGRSPAEEGRRKEEPRGVGRSPAGLRQSVCSVQVHRPPRSHRLRAPPASGLTRTVALRPSQVAPPSQTLSFQTQGKHPSSRTQCSHGQGQKQRSRQTRRLCFEFLPDQEWQTPRCRLTVVTAPASGGFTSHTARWGGTVHVQEVRTCWDVGSSQGKGQEQQSHQPTPSSLRYMEHPSSDLLLTDAFLG